MLASELDRASYPDLPGYEARTSEAEDGPTSFADTLAPFQDSSGAWRRWAPVVNLTITRETPDGTQILLCVRRADDEVHPDVVSTPTMRAPPDAFIPLDCIPTLSEEPTLQVFDGSPFGGDSWNWETDYKKPVNHYDYLAHTTMAAKLGAAGPLLQEWLKFYSYPEALRLQVVADSVTATGEDILETVAMLNIAVKVKEGSDTFPPRTGAHQKIFWADSEPFGRAWETKDLTYILPQDEIDPFRMCIQGACIASAYAQLHPEG